jgi:hypothetical protein
MRNLLVIFAVMCLACSIAPAQTKPGVQLNEWKLYGGYQYVSADTHSIQEALNLEHAIDPEFPALKFGNRQNLNGWNFGIQEDITKWFGVVVDVGGSYGERRILLLASDGINTSSRTRMQAYTFMGGPQFTLYRGSNFQPFARFLVGGAFFRGRTDILDNNVPEFSAVVDNDNGFAYGGGGGADIFFSRRFGVRVAADILRTPLFGETQNNLRATSGLIFRF